MKQKYILIVAVLVLSVILSACGTAAAQTPTPNNTEVRTLSVTGNGQAFVTPDLAHVSIGVQTQGENAAEAVEDNNAKIQEVIAALKAFGIPARDIQTSNFNIYPQQQYDEKGVVSGVTYIVDNSVSVTVRDLSTLGGLLDAAVDAGANFVHGISFDVEDRQAAIADARQKAVENARSQAEALAQAAGVQLGVIQHISTVGSYFPGPMFEGRGGVAADVAESMVPINPGELTITVDVSVVFEIQ